MPESEGEDDDWEDLSDNEHKNKKLNFTRYSRLSRAGTVKSTTKSKPFFIPATEHEEFLKF